jgi:hypothetical protein
LGATLVAKAEVELTTTSGTLSGDSTIELDGAAAEETIRLDSEVSTEGEGDGTAMDGTCASPVPVKGSR